MAMIKLLVLLSGFMRTFGYDDLSKEKSTSQTSTYPCPQIEICGRWHIASNAVDRNNLTCTRSKAIGGSSPDTSMWWRVDLGDIYSIHSVRIQFKDSDQSYIMRQKGRFAGFSIYLSNSMKREDWILCYEDGPELPPLDFNTTCIKYGRYVIYYNERLNGVTYPDGYETLFYTALCEVLVHGCAKRGFYGVNCDKVCPINCQDQRCNIVNGSCLGCIPGWTGEKCDKPCLAGWHGIECNKTCIGHCKNNAICHPVNGNCVEGCASGWMGDMCDIACKDENYGPGCIYNCSGHCLNGVYCNKQTGQCDLGCNQGYTESLCNKECPPGNFGHQCKELCNQNCLNNEICNHIDGVCTNGCKDGYIGERCNKSCQLGYFGRNCSGVCSKRCISTCDFRDGSCDCAPGWGELNCSEECIPGTFGVSCQHRCSGNCIANETCSRFDGSCPKGCKTPYGGLTCDHNALTGSLSIDDKKNYNGIKIVLSLSLTVNFIACAGIIYLLRGRILKNIGTKNTSCPSKNCAHGTQGIEKVLQEKNHYQEMLDCADNNEYQMIQVSEDIATEQGSTYLNLAFSSL